MGAKNTKQRVDLKYNSPLVNSAPWYHLWYNDRLYRGVDTPTMQSYIHFVVLHLNKYFTPPFFFLLLATFLLKGSKKRVLQKCSFGGFVSKNNGRV